MHTGKQPIPRPWNPWPVAIVGFFAVALVGFSVFILFSVRHPAELIAPDYYEQEMGYQNQFERLQRSRQHPRPATVSYDSNRREILIAVPVRETTASVTGRIQLYRPSAARLDREFELEPDTRGRQRIGAGTLAPGLWRVRVYWTEQDQEYYAEQKLVISRNDS